MGTMIELNDTLQITTEQGFPKSLDRAKHVKKPIRLADVAGKLFRFKDKTNARIYQLDPVRAYLAHNVRGKWLFWGRILIQSLRIEKVPAAKGKSEWVTSGSYVFEDLYDPDYQEAFTRREAPQGACYFS
jgi:hypothetical protein